MLDLPLMTFFSSNFEPNLLKLLDLPFCDCFKNFEKKDDKMIISNFVPKCIKMLEFPVLMFCQIFVHTVGKNAGNAPYDFCP